MPNFLTLHNHCALNDKLLLQGVAGLYGKVLRKVKAKIMNLCKVAFLILSFVATYVDSDSLIAKGRKLYFNSCQCGKAVSVGYGFFSLNTKYSIFTKKIANSKELKL